tara:strand:- start:180 stop:437 length:258 start_codon:yes stop_codon:yes gene_type:complete
MANRRYEVYKRVAPEGSIYSLWNQRHITDWALENGYRADPSLSRGVVVQTQSEANRAAFAELGHGNYDSWLEAQYPEESDAEPST